MNILTILGSPRVGGNTAKVLYWAEQAMQAAGHTVRHVNVRELSIRDCGECFVCRQPGSHDLCALEDDAGPVLRAMLEADMIVLGTPLFCWGYPARMKALLERMYCLTEHGGEDTAGRSRLAGKPIGMVLTSGGPVEGNADVLIQAYGHMAAYFEMRSLGVLHVPFCTEPGAISHKDHERTLAWVGSLLAGVAA